ncbi:MAG: L-arabinonate dehydratase [Pseudomonadota bacterium]
MPAKSADQLRSARWFATKDFRGLHHRSRALQMGLDPEDWEGRPIVAVVNTWSEINPCHVHFRERAQDVKRGILQAGGTPIELPALSLAETFVKPTTMLYRNMLAMEVEELLRCHPVDGAVLMGGCDKTTPGLVMGAISAGLPIIYLPAGPMLRGNWRGNILGSGSDTIKYWEERRAGTISAEELAEVEAGIARSYGTCMTMGTASTMTAIAEALGLCLPGASSIPAADAGHIRMAAATGRRIVGMIWEELVPARILTPAAVDNAVTVAMATGCSTNAVIHLIAMARRAGVALDLDDFDAKSRTTPVIANIRPSGTRYLMEDFFYAGGLRALMAVLGDRLDGNALTVTGKTLAEGIAGAEVHNPDVIRPLENPVYAEGSLAVLRGNLAPGGAVLKPAACDPRLHRHEGPAIVCDSYPDLKRVIDDEDLAITPDHVLVLRNAGPLGGPGMPEWGALPVPKALLRHGVRDMLRISDARMSGTAYGACVLHVAPEAHLGGPLALLQTGDRVRLDLAARRLDMVVDEAEISRRRAAWRAPPPPYHRGYGWMFAKHVGQADQGCDFDFLTRDFGEAPGEPVIF